MSTNDIILNDDIKNFRINSKTADIRVISDDIKEPIIRCSGSFDIVEEGLSTVISEKEKGKSKVTKLNLASGGYIESASDISISYINGVAVIGNISISREPITNDFIELIIPKNNNNLEFCLQTSTGNVTVENLNLTKLIVRTLSGNINLKDIDCLLASIITEEGNIDTEVLESILNYKLLLKSIAPNIQSVNNYLYPLPLEEKHELQLETETGSVKVLFKGKRAERR